jgi:DNA-binding transcriptional LysR family regulator
MLPRNVPLKALRAFDAAARHASFSGAARELSITQSAVSQQIRLLEDVLGTPLFRRLVRQIELTSAGELLARATGGALDQISHAIRQIQGRAAQETFAIGALASFSSRWLARRITSFCEKHPHLDVSLYSVFDTGEMEQCHADLAILYGDGSWKGHLMEEVFREYIFPVCNRKLAGTQRVRSAHDMLELPILRDADPKHDYWPTWLAASGVTQTRLMRGPKFDNVSDMITAALDGQGVALVRSALVDDEIRQGSLVRLLNVNLRAQYSYYLVWSKRPTKPEATAAFRSWLLAQLGATPGVVVATDRTTELAPTKR